MIARTSRLLAATLGLLTTASSRARQIGDRRWVVIRSVELAEPPASVGAAGALRGLGRER